MTTNTVIETSDASFAADVLERSKELPVIVDFWAPWCGPCRILGPLLETLANEYAGTVQLVKLNTDENPRVATQFQIQGIPAVFGFRDGRPVSQFVGALPEPQVRKFFEGLAPTGADRLAAEAAQLLKEGRPGAAQEQYEAALAENSQHEAASLGLAALLTNVGEHERALELVAKWPNDPVAKRARGIVNFHRAANGAERATLEARIAADETDAEAHYRLGAVLALAAAWSEAMEHLLISVRLDRALDDDGARLRLLDAFNVLGDENELTQEYRRKLSSVLF